MKRKSEKWEPWTGRNMGRTPAAALTNELCESACVYGSLCCAQHTEAHRDGCSPQVHSELCLRQSPALPICSSKHCLFSPTLHSPRQRQVTPLGQGPQASPAPVSLQVHMHSPCTREGISMHIAHGHTDSPGASLPSPPSAGCPAWIPSGAGDPPRVE